MMDAGRHPNIELLSYSEVVDVHGYVGNFQVKVKRKPRYVDEDKCTGCGDCTTACVWQERVYSEYEAGMGLRSAAYIPFAQAVPLKAVIDPNSCLVLTRGKCSQKCVQVCEADAIDFDQKEEFMDLKVGSVILATGYDMTEHPTVARYGYGIYDNVIDALQFERLTSAAGPTGGEVITRDGRVPGTTVFLHCIASRDVDAHEYCSRICCMYGAKQAHLALEKTGGQVYQFYIDMRTAGKGYEEFYKRMQHEGIHYVRGKVAERARNLRELFQMMGGRHLQDHGDLERLLNDLSARLERGGSEKTAYNVEHVVNTLGQIMDATHAQVEDILKRTDVQTRAAALEF